MSDIVFALLLVVMGPGFFAYGLWILRAKAWRDSIPLAEVVIDRAAGIEPPPRNTWDRRFALGQAWLLTIFGALVSLGVAAILIIDLVTE